MRPRGVVSKNAMGARKIRWSISLWRRPVATTDPNVTMNDDARTIAAETWIQMLRSSFQFIDVPQRSLHDVCTKTQLPEHRQQNYGRTKKAL